MKTVSRELTFGDLTVTVRELTVAEIRVMLSEKPDEDKEFDVFIDILGFDGVGVEDLYRFTDLKKESIETLSPSCLAKIAAVVKEVNSVFFNQFLPTVKRISDQIDSQKLLSETSSDKSVP